MLFSKQSCFCQWKLRGQIWLRLYAIFNDVEEMTRPVGNVGILPRSSADFKKIISDRIIEYHLNLHSLEKLAGCELLEKLSFSILACFLVPCPSSLSYRVPVLLPFVSGPCLCSFYRPCLPSCASSVAYCTISPRGWNYKGTLVLSRCGTMALRKISLLKSYAVPEWDMRA